MDFTKEQGLAISLRGEDIMVSAGAGAGKTRVLVSRIADLISDPDLSVDIDEILIMTFTKAAAAEMKERIGLEISQRLQENPDDRNLRRQNRLLRKASISTVHSFCNSIIRSNYQALGLDPAYRLGERGELELLQMEVIGEVLEESYQDGREDFLEFVENQTPGKWDTGLEDTVISLYRFSRSFPDVDRWYDQVLEKLKMAADDQEGGGTAMLDYFVKEGSMAVKEALEELHQLAVRHGFEDGPQVFKDRYDLVRSSLESLGEDISYDEYYKRLYAISWPRFPSGKKEEKTWPGKPVLKEFCDYVKDKVLGEQKKRLFRCPSEVLLKENKTLYPMTREYILLAKRFEDLYFARKKEQNVYDFNDLEHMALSLLVAGYDEKGDPVPTETARQIAGTYKAIFVDEYQDTSLIQETIINLLLSAGEARLFTVGDVKQSIYRFRQARPDLFVNRRNSYVPWQGNLAQKKDDHPGVRIELRDNFRSNPRVLWLVNQVFGRLMSADFGGVDYDEETELRPGKNGPMAGETTPSECIFYVKEDDPPQGSEPLNNMDLDAAVIACRMKELLDEGYSYRDMVILLRTKKEIETYAERLEDWGIPVYCEDKTGYFASREISLMMDYLAIVDNVYQDIPMASVMLSSIGGFSEEDLIRLKLMIEKECRNDYLLYDLLLLYLERGEDQNLRKKIEDFLNMLFEFRRRRKELPLGQLLWEIYRETGYFDEVQLLPDGGKRKQNLLMLLEKAEEYEKTMYKGLFYFKRYMDRLRTYDLEPDMAGAAGEEENVVRLMTIHKSKGLEFPVVFVSGLTHGFNKQGWENDSTVFHPELGIGMDWKDQVLRYQHSSMLKIMIQRQIKKESLEEELRILYVAMTRAEKKLILTGTVESKKLDAARDVMINQGFKLSASCYMDWLLPVILTAGQSSETIPMDIKYWGWKEVENQFLDNCQQEPEVSLREALETAVKLVDDSPVRQAFSKEYPFRESVGQKRKYSVSELKKLSQIMLPGEDGRIGEAEYREDRSQNLEDREKLLPAFLREDQEEKLTPSKRGTLVHKMMELLPFGEIEDRNQLDREIDRLKEAYPKLKEINGRWLEYGAWRFLFSDLGRDLCRMDRANKLHRELPFTIGLTGSDLAGINGLETDQSPNNGETIVVQGVIDLFAETEEGLWLIDYKTDYLRPGEEGILLDRYRTQMLYYKLALEQVWGEKVDRILLYSYSLGSFITLTEEDYGN